MGTVSFADNLDGAYASTLIHNRIDLKIKPVKGLIIAASLRNRVLISEYQNLIPGFAQQYTADNGIVNMSFNWVNKYPVLFNTTIDRLYIDWSNDKWDVRVGQQRLNWGINLTWNPNDIFNTYNLLDFDYEERPGADAIKVQYNFTSFSNLEAAFAPSRSPDSLIGALKYRFSINMITTCSLLPVITVRILCWAWAGRAILRMPGLKEKFLISTAGPITTL